MANKFKGHTLKHKVSMVFSLLFNNQVSYKKSFLKYHLIRRKYILSKSCEILGKDKFEPAPLLGRRILDVGCGLNQVADELAFRGAEVLAIDSNLEILTSAKNSGLHNGSPVEYVNVNYKNLEENQKFDIILFLDVLCNDNVIEYLEKAKKLLNKDGLIVISGSNRSVKSFVRNILIPRFLLKTFHLNIIYKDMIRLKKIKRVLDKLDFVQQDIQGIDFSFIAGKWHKTRSTRVRYLMCCVHKDNPANTNLIDK